MNGYFVREMPGETDKGLTRKWLVQSNLKVQTEATICAAQEQALRTNFTKNKIDKTSRNPSCRMCGERGETAKHVNVKNQRSVSIKEDMTHLQKLFHQKLCEKHKLERKEKWQEHCPSGVVEDDDVQ